MLYLSAIAAGLLIGYAVNGRLRRLGDNVRVDWLWLLYIALAAQISIAVIQESWLTRDVAFAILLGSYAVLLVWMGIAAAAHRSLIRWAFVIVAAGTALNLAAIAPNGGIPVSRYALDIAGAAEPAAPSSPQGRRFAVKHVIAGPKTIFNPIGDVIPIRPLRDVISPGDVLIGLGILLVIVAGMRMRPKEGVAVSPQGERGPEPQRVSETVPPLTASVTGAVRGGFLDREMSVQEFLNEFASGYAVGKAYDPMSEQIRHPSDSNVVLSQAMSIVDANLAGNVHGGVIMKLVDTAAGLAAIKHVHGRVVTVSMDEMSFLEPVFLTDVVTLRAQVNDVGRTSMEVGVRVEADNTLTAERRHVSSAYLVFVALDAEGKPRPVPGLQPETEEELRRMDDAKIRRRHRIARKEALVARRQAAAAEQAPQQLRQAQGATSDVPDEVSE